MANHFRPATVADAVAIVPHLRQADIDECDALVGPGRVLEMAVGTVSASIIATAWEKDGELVALFGVAGNLLGDFGTPWMFGTRAVDRNGRAVMALSGGYIRQMLELFPRLTNIVDVRNARSIRWLKRIGFKFHPAVPFGPAGMMFYPFSMGV